MPHHSHSKYPHRQGSIHIPLADTIAVSRAGEFRLTRPIQPLLSLLTHTGPDTVNLHITNLFQDETLRGHREFLVRTQGKKNQAGQDVRLA